MSKAEQEKLIDDLLATGQFEDADAVITAGLHLLRGMQDGGMVSIDDLERSIDEALASGPSAPMETADELIARFRQQMS